jgi:riboflavin biosynthesis pyrimidine reductase
MYPLAWPRMTEAVRLRQLLPEPRTVTPAQAAAHLVGRDVLMLNMVVSVDGHTAVDGRSGGIRGGEGDRELFHALRAYADAILVGTATLRAERYGPWIRDEPRWAMRRDAGLTQPPVGATLTRLGDVPWDIPLFAAADQRVIVYSGTRLEVPRSVAADVEVVGLDPLDPSAAIADLRARGVHSILCEGGARLNGALLAVDAVDELEVVIAPQLVGGTDPLTVIRGALATDVALTLVDAHESRGTLLLRYRIAKGV